MTCYSQSIKEGFKLQTKILKDNSGRIIRKPSTVVNKFQKYFEELLKNKNNNIGSRNNEEYEKLVYHTIEPESIGSNIDETKIIIKSLKNNKSPGEDTINSELYKSQKKKH